MALAPDGQPHVICGLAGVGKTAVALNLAARFTHEVLVWWLNAADATTLAAGLSSLANRLNIPGEKIRQSSGDRHLLADLVWEQLDRGAERWLLVIDNADEVDLLTARSGQLVDNGGLIRHSRRGLVLITSRHGNQSVWGATTVLHRLEALDAKNGARLLLNVAGKRAGSVADARELAVRLGGLPFGLMIAGQYLRSTEAGLRGIHTFRQYLNRLDRDLADLEAADPRVTLATAWGMSFDYLTMRGFHEARLAIQAISLLASAPIPVDLATEAVARVGDVVGPWRWRHLLYGRRRPDSTRNVISLLSELCDLGMLSLVVAARNKNEVSCVAAHPIVTEVNLKSLQSDAELLAALTHSVVVAVATATTKHETDSPAEASWWPLVAVHIVHLLDQANALSSHDIEAVVIAANRAYVGLFCAGDYISEAIVTSKSVEVAVRLLGSDHPAALAARHSRAGTLASQGEVKSAEQSFWTVLADRTRVLGPYNLDTLETQHNLAGLLLGTSRPAEAESMLIPVVAARRQLLGDTADETMTARHNLAAARAEQGKFVQAMAEFRALLADRRTTQGESNRLTLLTRRRIALLLEQLGDPEGACCELRFVAFQLRTGYGNSHPEALTTAHLLGRVLARMGSIDAAAIELRDVLAARTRVLGATHPQTIETAELLASLT